MSLPMNSNSPVEMRIANFSNLKLALDPVLTLDSHYTPSLLKELRKYADLPYGFLFTADQVAMVNDLLLELKKNKVRLLSLCIIYR